MTTTKAMQVQHCGGYKYSIVVATRGEWKNGEQRKKENEHIQDRRVW